MKCTQVIFQCARGSGLAAIYFSDMYKVTADNDAVLMEKRYDGVFPNVAVVDG